MLEEAVSLTVSTLSLVNTCTVQQTCQTRLTVNTWISFSSASSVARWVNPDEGTTTHVIEIYNRQTTAEEQTLHNFSLFMQYVHVVHFQVNMQWISALFFSGQRAEYISKFFCFRLWRTTFTATYHITRNVNKFHETPDSFSQCWKMSFSNSENSRANQYQLISTQMLL